MGWFWGQPRAANGFGASTTATEVTEGVNADGLTAVITGGFGGIGEHTARTLAMRGAHVVVAGRNLQAGAAAKDGILKDIPTAKVDVMELDLASFASVRRFADEYLKTDLPLNILINNAGILAPPFKLTKDGFELQFATNHLGHFLLTNLLLEKMKATAQSSGIEGRIVNVASEAHRRTYKEHIRWDKINDEEGYSPLKAYGQSKLANIYHAQELARRLKAEGAHVTANSVHPGVIYTNIFKYNKLFDMVGKCVLSAIGKTIPQGAATTCYVALHPNVTGVSGEYFDNVNIQKTAEYAKDAAAAKRLWDLSVEMTSKQVSQQ